MILQSVYIGFQVKQLSQITYAHSSNLAVLRAIARPISVYLAVFSTTGRVQMTSVTSVKSLQCDIKSDNMNNESQAKRRWKMQHGTHCQDLGWWITDCTNATNYKHCS